MRIYYGTEAKSTLQFKSKLRLHRNMEIAPSQATLTPMAERLLLYLGTWGTSLEGNKKA